VLGRLAGRFGKIILDGPIRENMDWSSQPTTSGARTQKPPFDYYSPLVSKADLLVKYPTLESMSSQVLDSAENL